MSVKDRLTRLRTPPPKPLAPLEQASPPGLLALDLGCGASKLQGAIGLDLEPAPGVDHVLDLSRDPLPFDDDTVGEVFSSHFVEHIEDPEDLFRELSRVCASGARFELWTPYAWHDTAVFTEHKSWWTHAFWLHVSCEHWRHWRERLGARWRVDEFVYVIEPHMQRRMSARGFDLRFAVEHFNNVVTEFCVRGWIDKSGSEAAPTLPQRCYAASRADSYHVRYALDPGPELSIGSQLRAWIRR